MADLSTSEIHICNRALIALGSPSITSLSDDERDNFIANDCKVLYADLLKELLGDYEWSFGRARAFLAPVSQPIYNSLNVEGDYSYAFQLPTDFARIVAVNLNNNFKDLTVPFPRYQRIGNYILFDGNVCYLLYIRNRIDPTLMSGKFQAYLVNSLAAELAYKVTDAQSREATLLQRAEIAFVKAKTYEGEQELPIENPEGPLLKTMRNFYQGS